MIPLTVRRSSRASDAEDHKTVATIAGQVIKLEQLAAKANGDLIKHVGKRTVHQHIHLSPEWRAFQSTILTILRRHPAAYEDVVRVFREREQAERQKTLSRDHCSVARKT
jgi:hypothetical protein